MNTATKLHIPSNKTNAPLTIVHMAGNTPFYYVEESEINGRNVSVAYFNENDPASEIENAKIPTSELIAFTNEFYRDYNTLTGDALPKAGIEYLQDNLKSVVTDFLNAGKGVSHE